MSEDFWLDYQFSLTGDEMEEMALYQQDKYEERWYEEKCERETGE